MKKQIAVMLDGGHVRVYAQKAHKTYDPSYIEKIALACCGKDEEITRVLYYDCAPYTGTATLPVSGTQYTFTGNDAWLHELARKDLFAVRRGVLKFRGYVLKNIPFTPAGALTDTDFKPQFEQKGVDMRIGLDMATISAAGRVDRIVLATNDTDCIPAMKHARKAGLQVVLIELPNRHPAPDLLAHTDFRRKIAWP